MAHHIADVTQQTFEQEVLAASYQQPVLVDFWAPWCGPCRTLTPLLEKLADGYQGRFRLAKINSDAEQPLASHYQVRSIPTVKAFVNGEMVNEFTGALSEGQLREFIDRLLPSLAEPLRAEAAELWANGDREGALARLVEGSQLDPANEGVRLDAAEVLIALGRQDEARQLLAMEYLAEVERAQSMRAQLDLAASAVDAGQLRAMLERVTADPRDHAARIELAKALAANRRYEEAFDQLLESIMRDKTYNEGEARRTMLRLFEVVGAHPESDDLIRQYRRLLATALN
ncbi:MAG TPA: thioredoxin [Rhodocyclaceae bacterium]|nr:thioredoxin [Rhodocyclaceae bacterium]